MKRPVPGLGIVSAAPSARAATVCSAPSSASEETIITFAPAAAPMIRGYRLETARPRHFQIEDDDVHAAFAQRFDRVLGGAGDSGDLEGGIAFDHARENRAGDGRIVDDHQPDAPAQRLGSRLAVPRSGERPLHGSGTQATPTS